MMPNMDGFELTRRLRLDERTAGVKMILLTARGLSADRLEGFAVGADDYVIKPFDTPDLLARIGEVLVAAEDDEADRPERTSAASAWHYHREHERSRDPGSPRHRASRAGRGRRKPRCGCS